VYLVNDLDAANAIDPRRHQATHDEHVLDRHDMHAVEHLEEHIKHLDRGVVEHGVQQQYDGACDRGRLGAREAERHHWIEAIADGRVDQHLCHRITGDIGARMQHIETRSQCALLDVIGQRREKHSHGIDARIRPAVRLEQWRLL